MYYRAREEVLSALKRRAQCVQKLGDAAFCEGEAQGGARGSYTLCNPCDNLYLRPDSRHLAEFSGGKNVRAKLSYLGSSTALLYNLLGNRQMHFAGNACQIFYCQRLRALRTKNAYTTADAVLLDKSGETCVCVEAKLLEWFVYRVNPLRDGFLHAENYAHPAAAACFPDVFALLIPYYQTDAYEHVGCLRQYDGFSVLRQLLSLYYTIAEERFAETKKTDGMSLQRVRRLTYVSIYWRLLHAARLGVAGLKIERAAVRMEREAALFRDLITPVERLFRETMDVELEVHLTDMWTLLQKLDVPDERRAWMRRYAI